MGESEQVETAPENRAVSLRGMQRIIRYHSQDREARALRRELIARERELGQEFLVRLGGTERTHLRVSLAALRKHAPDLVPRDDRRLKREIVEYLESERSRTMDLVADEVARQIARRRAG